MRRRTATALAFVVATAVGIGGLAFMGEPFLHPQAWDRAVLLALRDPADPAEPIGPDWLQLFFYDVTALGGYTGVSIAGLVAAGFLLLARRTPHALLVVVSIGGGMIVENALKSRFDRPRPDLVAHLVEVQTASFPSGHALMSAVAYLTLGALLAAALPRRRLRIYVLSVAILLTLLIGASRVYLGVHWPSDVVAGWIVGAAWATACGLLLRWSPHRGSRADRD
ncbi:MAG TPA: phosphatase PAP2 family protein [Beijerinckiaceae bacterium]|nr:phosphatase PAP2 family protein [Beijerinckiaceae bacterium]